jgi:hypothetical protein
MGYMKRFIPGSGSRTRNSTGSHSGSNGGGGAGGIKVEVELNEQFVEDELKMLKALMLLDTKFEKSFREAVAKEITDARKRLVSQIEFKNGDPRGARHSIRKVVYNKIFGGALVIPPRTKAGMPTSYEPPRKILEGKRGGNRMIRQTRTNDIMHYGPMDRGFILRMVNAGTHPRYANGRNGRWSANGNNRTFFRLQRIGEYYRGSISPRNFFHDIGNRELATAMNNLRRIVDEEYERIIRN